MAPVTPVPEPYNKDWSSRRSVIGHSWILKWSIMTVWLRCLFIKWTATAMLKILDFNCRLGCKKICSLFFVQNDRPAKWRWCQICQHCRKLWWSSCIETAAEILPKDGSSKLARPLRPCNICLIFKWRRATMKIERFLRVVCCLKSHRFITDRT